MKVIKKGRPQKAWAHEFICTGAGNGNGGCGATLLVERTDIYETVHHDYGGGTDIFVTFTCTVCHVETDITENIPPRPIQSKSGWQATQGSKQ